MVTATLVLCLHGGLLAEDAPRTAHLLDAPLQFEQMTRAELLAERDRLESLRPSELLPIFGATIGFASAVAAVNAFFVLGTSFLGIAVYLAVILVTGATVALAVGVGSLLYILTNRQKGAEYAERVSAIDSAFREGRCLTVAGQAPCGQYLDR